ncbi:hypothetical protein HI792_15840 [Ralstonia solanacearum]|nr:hypothetical protein HI792_15840 [Ralstonia solanacearum]
MSQADATRRRLRMALAKLKRDAAQLRASGKEPRKISISAVAREAGVSHSLVHTKYPDIAERIRHASGRTLIEQRKAKAEALLRARARISDLRQQINGLRTENTGLASENGRLILVVDALRAELAASRAGVSVLHSVDKQFP